MSGLSLRTMLVFVLFSLLWNLNSCGVIGFAESKQDNDRKWYENPIPLVGNDFDKYPSGSFDSDTPFQETSESDEDTILVDWNKLTRKPVDWRRFNVDSYTENIGIYIESERDKAIAEGVKPYDWKTFTIPPMDWSEFTMKPISYRYRRSSATPLKWVIGTIAFVLSLLLLCKRMCKAKSTDTSQAGLPSMIIIAARSRNRTATDETPVPLLPEGHPSSVSSTTDDVARDSSNTVVDKPPDYSAVMIADSVGGKINFPCPVPESPPPKYEDGRVNVV